MNFKEFSINLIRSAKFKTALLCVLMVGLGFTFGVYSDFAKKSEDYKKVVESKSQIERDSVEINPDNSYSGVIDDGKQIHKSVTEGNNDKIKVADKSEIGSKMDFVGKESKLAIDTSTEVLIDAEPVPMGSIDSFYKHGDHWHVLTKDGKEYITYKDPALMSESEKSNISSVAKETEKYSPEQIVEHLELVYEKNGSLILKWLHVDHYHDSIYGISEDIEGVIVEDAPLSYILNPDREIPSQVENKRYFKNGSKVYIVNGKSEKLIKLSLQDSDESKSENKLQASDKIDGEFNEGNYEKYSPEQIVAHTEKIYEKKNLTILKWLHVDHYHESAYGISDDIAGVEIEEAPSNYREDANNEIPSTIENKKFYRSGSKILYVVKGKESDSKNDKDTKNKDKNDEGKEPKKEGQNNQNNSDKLKGENTEGETEKDKVDIEKNIDGSEIVSHIERIYLKSGLEVLYWLHDTPGNPHYHESIVGISDDIGNVRIIKARKSQISGYSEIASSVYGKRYYRGKGSYSDTVYWVDVFENEDKPNESGTPSGGGGNAPNDTNNDDNSGDTNNDDNSDDANNDDNSDDTNNVDNSGDNNNDDNSADVTDAENNVSGEEIVSSLESIYMKKSILVLKWLHNTPGNPHYHESAVGISDDIKNVKIVDAPADYNAEDKNEIPSTVFGKKYYRGTGENSDTIFVVYEKSSLFEEVIDGGDQVNAVYKGKSYSLFPIEYRMALLENKFRPNEDSKITLDIQFDDTRVIVVDGKKLEGALDRLWAIRKDKSTNEEIEDPNFARYRWYIVRKDENQYKELEVEEDWSDWLEGEAANITMEDDGALLKVDAVDKNENVIDEVKYLIKIKGEAVLGEVSEHTKERIRNVRKIYYKGDTLTMQWWHVNHWHYEPLDWYGDLSVEKAPEDYERNDSKRVERLSLDERLLNRVYYLENDKIVYVDVSTEEFLSYKADEILRISELSSKATGKIDKIEFSYSDFDKKYDINRFLEIYEGLNDAAKENIKAKKEKLLGLIDSGDVSDADSPDNTDNGSDVDSPDNTDGGADADSPDNTDDGSNADSSDNTDDGSDVDSSDNIDDGSDADSSDNTDDGSDVDSSDNTDDGLDVDSSDNTDDGSNADSSNSSNGASDDSDGVKPRSQES